MKKGQLSLDLILTLIIVLVIINSFGLITSHIKTSQEKITFENQLRNTNSELASLITNTQSLTDTNFSITIYNQKLNYSGTKIYPSISIDNNIISLSGEEVTVNNTFADNNISITTSVQKMVITNE